MSVRVLHGDMLDVLPTLDAASIDSVVTDPPYHLTSIVKRFGGPAAAAAKVGKTGAYARASRGFMGKTWDGGDIAFRPETWAEVWRVMKPGAHLAAFGGSRTVHRMACAIEDAGFEIRDTLFWLYGSGFPKSHDVSKALDKMAGAERERSLAPKKRPNGAGANVYAQDEWTKAVGAWSRLSDEPLTEAARQWAGWGTALKPAVEPIILARKPLSEGSVAANVARHGTGAVHVDACRVAGKPWKAHTATGLAKTKFFTDGDTPEIEKSPHDLGRWPPNILHDGSPEVLEAFGLFSAPGQSGAVTGQEPSSKTNNVYGQFNGRPPTNPRADTGTAARYFPALGLSHDDLRFHYGSKADADDRCGSKHPTVKPLSLMRWLVRLITPPGGTVLDPFAGSGTTGAAALLEGFEAVLCEREAEYVADIHRRLGHMRGEDAPLFATPAA